MNFSSIISSYESFLYVFAELVIYTLELLGIIIILVGTVKAIFQLVRHYHSSKSFNVVINLGRSLAFALECKMGAEIIHTVIVRDLKDLGILAVVILIRALLAVIIHWEIRMEQRSEQDSEPKQNKEENS